MYRLLSLFAGCALWVASPPRALAATPPAPSHASEPSVPDTPRGVTHYRLDPSQSWLWVLVRYDRKALLSGNDHAVRASDFLGTVTWDPTELTPCAIRVVIPVTALEVDPPGMREHAGLEGQTSDRNKAKIKANLSGKHQLEADKFPTISFEATQCSTTTGAVDVTGVFTLHGVSQPVTVRLNVAEDGQRFRATGSFDILHQTYGFKPYTAALGALRNDKTLGIHLDLVGTHANSP